MKLHTYLSRIDLIKTIKIALGCLLSYLIAGTFHLDYSSSVIVITLLSISDTRKETFQTAGKRALAFVFAVLLALLLFPPLHYTPFSIFLFLFLYYPICRMGRFTEGFSMSTVLILHLWNQQTVRLPAVLNEALLMALGISTGFLMNLYMPNRIHLIRTAQKEIEAQFSAILKSMAKSIFSGREDARLAEDLRHLQRTLAEASDYAAYTENNFLFRDMSYYSLYMEMRKEQSELLKRIAKNLPRFHESYVQTASVSAFIHMTADSMNEYNNAEELLYRLSEMRSMFKAAPLPATRPEFESRAVLYEIVNELQEFLLLKLRFSENLTPYQIETFWKHKKS